MALRTIYCPYCQSKYNVRDQSFGTKRRCEECGQKFAIERQPVTLGGCGGLLAMIGVGCVVVVGCCGVFSIFMSSGDRGSPPAPTRVSHPSPPPVIAPSQTPPPAAPVVQEPPPAVESEPAVISPVEPSVEPPAVPPNVRTWTSADGKFSTEARFGGMAFGKVTLHKPDGTTITLDAQKLSEDDREWIKARAHR